VQHTLQSLVERLEDEVRRLQLKKDILERTVELLGKDPGADPNRLTNAEKTMLVGMLRHAYRLKELLDVFVNRKLTRYFLNRYLVSLSL